MPLRKAVLSLAILLLATAPLALAQGTYTQIDYPGTANGTSVQAIDNGGTLVGSYVDNDGNSNGFVLSNGTYSTIDYPGAQETYLSGINDAGEVVGSTYNPEVGFLYDLLTQTFSQISDSGATYTVPAAINNAGLVAGYLVGSSGVQGFVLRGTTYHSVFPPKAIATYAWGIGDNDEVVGLAYSPKGIPQSFAFQRGKYIFLSISGETTAKVRGISPNGSALVGWYQPTGSYYAGFVLQNEILQELQFPSSLETSAYGINNVGVVVGSFNDLSNSVHGFT
jgi:uncharacterized membrane protein